MVIAWVLTGIGQLIPFPTQFQTLTMIAAFALTALWMGHLLAYAFKVSIAAHRRQKTASNQVAMARRDMMPLFARALAATAVATTLPGLALAQCGEAAATRCQAAVLDCRAKCARSAHREEVVRACRQECFSAYVTCRTEARCS